MVLLAILSCDLYIATNNNQISGLGRFNHYAKCGASGSILGEGCEYACD